MTIRVLMIPQLDQFGGEESGIKRVVENYYKYLPNFDIQLVHKDASYDLIVSHASAYPNPDIVHCHGLYWTADYPAGNWEWSVNQELTHSLRNARYVTVPSTWVAEAFQRDMRFSPTVIPHGIDWQDWKHDEQNFGYALWNKNRVGDVCDPHWVGILASAFPKIHFMSTFPGSNEPMQNVSVTGVIPNEKMKTVIQRAGVYLSTTKETFGIGVLEALASGVPVLGFRFGGNVDTVEHGVTGYLANPGDIDDLKAGLEYCVKFHDVLGTNARESAKKWSWMSSAEKVAGVYRLAMNIEKPTVSIIIPSYNYADKVGRAIESALNQTYPMDKIIVVDDGSTDNTRTVVEEFSIKTGGRVMYHYQNNAGVANARNAGIAMANSKYVCCLDADDAIRPTFLETCVRALEAERSLGIAYTGLWYIKPDGSEGESPWPPAFNYDAQLHGNNQIPTCCVFRKEMWTRLGGYQQRYAPGGAGSEDAEFWLRAGSIGYNARKVTNEPLFVYSWMSGRVSGNKDYVEVDWLQLHPWVKDGQHPFASVASAKKMSHPVRQYDEPSISVIIPVGKGHEKEVMNALDSLESQTFRKWEAIVVNDTGSAELELDAYPYARVVRTDAWLNGKGAGAARNLGVKHARAPFIVFLDADDWLYPEALDKMLYEWAASGSITYTDYVGKATIDDPVEVNKLGNRVLYYNEKTHEAVIAHQSFNYDCEKAVRQPDPEMYIWSLITALFPKAWHNEIGGFDEDMESWEDWDYWIRMAKAGKCFRRIPEQLVVYRFSTGNRREHGLHEAQHLIKYLIDKYKDVKIMGCGCRGEPIQANVPAIQGMLSSKQNGANSMSVDEQIVLIQYEHPNRGMHRVIGGATGQDYGYRGGGDRFLVDVRDIAVQPGIYVVINTTVEAPREQVIETPPPVVKEAVVDREVFLRPEKGVPMPASISKEESFDLQLIPGITSTIAAQLNAMGVFGLKELSDLELDDLMKIKGIGKARAEAIMNYVQDQLDKN